MASASLPPRTFMATATLKRLLLIGGGHAHLFVLETLRKRRSEWHGRLEVTLLSRTLATAYSGMLPGLIAGHYRTRQCLIDLPPLAAQAGATLVQADVEQLDLARNVALGGGREWEFDLVSIDIGSSPSLTAVPGAAQHAAPVKPIDLFLQHWRELQDQIGTLTRPIHMVVVGGGAGGVELVLAMAHRLEGQRALVKWSLVTSGELLAGYPRRAARLMVRHLAEAGVALRTNAEAACIEQGKLHFADGSSAAFDALIWATGAAAQSWVAASGLACEDNGFVIVNEHLQSTSHPQVFAAGDIAVNPLHRRPKAGVFAVRQGPVLADNLLRQVLDLPLASYRPQMDYLSLLATGQRHAIASWYGLVWEAAWLWRWKDRIDQRFIRRFSPPFEAPVDAQSIEDASR
ncbi:MAG TPA: FAD-dependent oxidoreductase [Oxalobacteraceae bacterium]|nr:FAD-dependent oxidoreductase [Oxalobacteraceae bacterium]